MSLGFLYEWTDHLTGLKYIGSRKGTPYDGYVCSSKYMLEEYNQRSQDFSRKILMIGEWKFCREMEAKLLESLDAARNPEYYNRNNQNGKFLAVEKQTEEHIRKRIKNQFGNCNAIGNKSHLGIKAPLTTVKKMQETRRKIQGKPIQTPFGQFNSIAEGAEILQINYRTLTSKIKRKTNPDWRFI